MRDRIAVFVACFFLSTACVATGAEMQPGPPASVPPPPDAYSVPAGQWVQTQQYGWVWMPYADQYTYAPPDGAGEPLEYLYYPSVGWSWVSAPWVWGVGPMPSFGRAEPRRFAWYEHGWWRTPQRWQYRAAPERPGYASRGVRQPPPGRPGSVARPAPQARGGRLEGERRAPAQGRIGGAVEGERGGGERAAPARPAPRRGERGDGEEGGERGDRGDREGR